MYTEFKLIRKIFLKGKPSQASMDRYAKFKEDKDWVLDISTKDKDRVQKLEEEYGVKMSSSEKDYLVSQLDSTIARNNAMKIVCFANKNDIDPAWLEQEDRKAKRDRYYNKQKQEMIDIFSTVSEKDDEQDMSVESDNSDEDFEIPKGVNEVAGSSENNSCGLKRKWKFVQKEDKHNDPITPPFRHVRDSERKVKDSVYLAITDLIEIGLSIPEAQKAVLIVSNRLFAWDFKIEDEDNDDMSLIDVDTIPSERSI